MRMCRLEEETAECEIYEVERRACRLSAQVSFRDCSVDQTAQLVLTFSMRYTNCADGKLRSGIHGVRGNLLVQEGFPRRIREMN